MSRCEHCSCRNSWDCEDGYYRVSDNNLCDNFKLDFDTLSRKQQRGIQKSLMSKEDPFIEDWD